MELSLSSRRSSIQIRRSPDLSLIDERNERPLRVAFVAVIAVWATTVLFALA